MQIFTAKTKLAKNCELTLIGVNDSDRLSPSAFPKNFNKDAFYLWKDIFDSDWFKDLKSSNKPTSDMWLDTVQHYLSLCSKNGVYPFTKASERSNNEVILSFLAAARATASTFFDRCELFKRVKIKSVFRTFKFGSTSFTVESKAILREIQDPTFEAWLKTPNEPGFVKEEGRWCKHLRANVDVFVDKERGGGYSVTLRIYCHSAVRIPEFGKIPSRAKLTQYAEKTLWLPAVRSNRFKDVGNKLF